MIEASILQTYHNQLDGLRQVVSLSEARSIADPPDLIFSENQNVFIKSFLVSACSILEAFIQDIASQYMFVIQGRLNAVNIPHNYVAWVSGNEKVTLEFKAFAGNKSKKDISSMVSPNYWKTQKVFQRIGVDIADEDLESFKDYISAIVEKRNNIVHHNDDALDLSFSDIISAIDRFKEYTKVLFDIVLSDPHLMPA